MRNLLTLFLVLPTLAFSQDITNKENPDLAIEPDPYKKTYYQDKGNYKEIESITIISRKKNNSFTPDTLQASFYDDRGLRYKYIRYEKNKKASTTFSKYNTDKNIVSWEAFEIGFSTATYFSYNKNQQLQSTRQLKVVRSNGKIDSTETSRKSFTYENTNLVESTSSGFGEKMIQKYTYDNQRLLLKKGSHISKDFIYDIHGNLVEIKEYRGKEIDQNMLAGLKKFGYNELNQLTTDSVLFSSYLKDKKYQTSSYSYNKAGHLELMEVKFGDLYRKLNFEYVEDRIMAINVETNGISAFLKSWIPYDIQGYYSFPINYREVFDYDEQGNRTSKKEYVNNDLLMEVEYKITYKK